MDPFRGDEPAVPQSKKEESADLRFEVVAETFLELFQLLQDYAPVWYTKRMNINPVRWRRTESCKSSEEVRALNDSQRETAAGMRLDFGHTQPN